MNSTDQQIMDYIVDFKRKTDGLSPAYRDIMLAMGIKSTSTIHYRLRVLEAKGKISVGREGIRVTGGKWTAE